MTCALAHGLLVAGLILSGAFALGMTATVAVMPVLAVVLRVRLMSRLARSERWRHTVSRGLEFGAAFGVLLLGALPLLNG